MSACDLVVGRWGARFLGRRFPCAVGRGGLRRDKREGDGATPVGRWALESVYFRPDRTRPPLGAAPARAIRRGMRWSDDPGDPAYNSELRGPYPLGVETLWRADRLYDLIGVLDHNRHPAVPGAGSAIFLHAWRKPRHPTAGCIAFRPVDLMWILDRWRSESRVIVQP